MKKAWNKQFTILNKQNGISFWFVLPSFIVWRIFFLFTDIHLRFINKNGNFTANCTTLIFSYWSGCSERIIFGKTTINTEFKRTISGCLQYRRELCFLKHLRKHKTGQIFLHVCICGHCKRDEYREGCKLREHNSLQGGEHFLGYSYKLLRQKAAYWEVKTILIKHLTLCSRTRRETVF